MGAACTKDFRWNTRPPPPPYQAHMLTSQEIRALLVGKIGMDPRHIHIADNKYACYPVADLKAFLAYNHTDIMKYKTDTFDCDDFARVLIGNERVWFRKNRLLPGGSSLGMVWGDLRTGDPHIRNMHAMNIFVDSERRIWLVEPQTDEMFDATSVPGEYHLCVL